MRILRRQKWSERHWMPFLNRVGGLTGLRRNLMLDNGTIGDSQHPYGGTSEGTYFTLLKSYNPDEMKQWEDRAKRIARLYRFFLRRCPNVVVASCPDATM